MSNKIRMLLSSFPHTTKVGPPPIKKLDKVSRAPYIDTQLMEQFEEMDRRQIYSTQIDKKTLEKIEKGVQRQIYFQAYRTRGWARVAFKKKLAQLKNKSKDD